MDATKKSVKIRELRSLIFRYFDTEAEFASALGWKKQKLNKITNGQMQPDINDLNEMAPLLEKSVGELAEIFLRAQSPNGRQSA